MTTNQSTIIKNGQITEGKHPSNSYPQINSPKTHDPWINPHIPIPRRPTRPGIDRQFNDKTIVAI